jgi:hypothetical protein
MTRISGAVNLDLSSLTLDTGGLEQLSGKDLVNAFGTIAAAIPSTDTLITSYTVLPLKKVRVKGVYFEGDADALYKLFINGTMVWQGRNAWTERNTPSSMEYEATAGQLIELKVRNLHNTNRAYSGGFYGYQLDP